jgi:hypothetical protein
MVLTGCGQAKRLTGGSDAIIENKDEHKNVKPQAVIINEVVVLPPTGGKDENKPAEHSWIDAVKDFVYENRGIITLLLSLVAAQAAQEIRADNQRLAQFQAQLAQQQAALDEQQLYLDQVQDIIDNAQDQLAQQQAEFAQEQDPIDLANAQAIIAQVQVPLAPPVPDQLAQQQAQDQDGLAQQQLQYQQYPQIQLQLAQQQAQLAQFQAQHIQQQAQLAAQIQQINQFNQLVQHLPHHPHQINRLHHQPVLPQQQEL